ncbi:hypothetical protein G6F57_020876 [Rhizopus arrhizus]|nr:hypothetical protein G6F23_015286 [Rhizopus arrhizus]KAG0968495.1 hypothetical protein G6F29_014273 [Rhizopus arrhizus]KAG0998812.1 hypothetical protein G6F27_013851 [Rhizopus arrhizus]KAG1002195.1 hypothetical protein G6F26_014210 [Rhizopus arrhizus]KAG1058552.1 hypothetical protein G6F41_013898 [Rhizopus arrhizus]
MPAPSVILGAALVTLWKAHWRLVFDNIPFCLAPTLIAAEKLIAHFANEQVSGQGNSAFAILHVTFDMCRIYSNNFLNVV